jgi:hypothetical protein
MPSSPVNSSQPLRVASMSHRKGIMLQNNNSFAVWLRWDGNKNVTGHINDTTNCGIKLGIGGSLTLNELDVARSNNKEIWAIADPVVQPTPAHSGYINYIEL